MTNPQMPAGMRPRISDYGFNAPKGAEQAEVEGGVDRFGLAYESAAKVFSVTLVLDLYEFSIWNLFFERRIALGTITFDMLLDSGHGIAPHPCNIVKDSYSAKRSAGAAGMVVSFQVQAESQSFDFTEAEIDQQLLAYDLFGRLAPGFFKRLATFANEDTLVLDFDVDGGA